MDLYWLRYIKGILPVIFFPLTAAVIKKQSTEDRHLKEHAKLQASNEESMKRFEHCKGELMEKWQCLDASCPNQNGYCWIRHDNAHVIVD